MKSMKIDKNLEANMFVAAEFGYVSCEKGHNIELMRENLRRVLDGKDPLNPQVLR